jgi:hypothetical protein
LEPQDLSKPGAIEPQRQVPLSGSLAEVQACDRRVASLRMRILLRNLLTPKRTWFLLLGAAALSLWCEYWDIPAVCALALTLSGVIVLFVVPGLILFSIARRRASAPLNLVWIAVAGPVVLAFVGLIAWVTGGTLRPVDVCRGATCRVIVAALVYTWRERPASWRG